MCPQLKGHRLFPWDSTNGSCHSALLSLSPPNYGISVRAVQKAVSQQVGTLLLREQNLPLPARSAWAQQSFPHHAEPWPVTQGLRSGEDGINIVSIDCLNSDLMFSFSVFLGLFLSPSCQTSSCGRPSWKEIQPELELWRKQFVSSVPGVPSQDPHRPLQEKRPRDCATATTCKEKLPALRCNSCKFRIQCA